MEIYYSVGFDQRLPSNTIIATIFKVLWYRGIRVYTRCAMGMPWSETALEELMCRVLGDCFQDGCIAKLTDDMYCGGETIEELIDNWERVLKSVENSGLCLSAPKTMICPRATSILGWSWIVGAYKILGQRSRFSGQMN